MAEIKLNADFLNDLYACKDVAAVVALAKSKGFDLSEEQAGKIFAYTQREELTDEELEQITGGNYNDYLSFPAKIYGLQ